MYNETSPSVSKFRQSNMEFESMPNTCPSVARTLLNFSVRMFGVSKSKIELNTMNSLPMISFSCPGFIALSDDTFTILAAFSKLRGCLLPVEFMKITILSKRMKQSKDYIYGIAIMIEMKIMIIREKSFGCKVDGKTVWS